MEKSTDEELMSMILKKNTRALRILYDRYEVSIFNYVLRYTGSRDIAQDLLQETFTRVWYAAHTFSREPGKFRSWLYKIALNITRSEMAKKRYDYHYVDVSEIRGEQEPAHPKSDQPDAPSNPFVQVNSAYDENAESIKKEGLYSHRDEFLMDIIDQLDKMDFGNIVIDKIKQFHDSRRLQSWYYSRDRGLALSAPVTNDAGLVQGTLFLRIDDSINHELYYSRNRAESKDPFNNYLPLFIAFAIVSGIFLWFLLPTWVYIDAQQHDVNNPGVWAFITLISLVFGLAIYVITRPATMRSHHCPQCENELNGSGAFCPHCGFDLSNTYCPQCQYPIKQDWTFCPSCRAGLQSPEEPETAAEPAQEE
ncbi:MAG: sigma factor [bacterium]